MNQSIQFLAALVFLGSLSTPLFSAGASKAKGKLNILVGCDLKNKKHQTLFFLESTEAGTVKHVPLDFAGNTPSGLKSGQTLELTGGDKNGRFSVQKLDLISEPPAPALLATPSGTPSYSGPIVTYVTPPACTHTVLAILLNFTDKPLSCSPSQVDSVAFSSSTSASAVYRENTFNGFGLQGTVIGPFTLTDASSSCDPYGYSSQANAAALAAGYDPYAYDHVMYVLPSGGCPYGGLGELSAKRTWLWYCDWTQVFTHELGHNLGLGHASAAGQEYDDASDTMGFNLRQFNGPHRAALKDQICFNDGPKIEPVIQCGVYNLHALESPSTDNSILKIAKPDSGGYYWLSYRVPTGVDSGLSSTYAYKTSIHYWVGTGWVQTQFLNALDDGVSYVDSVNGITFTQLSHDSDHAVVSVSIGTCPNTPTITPSATPSHSPTPTWTLTFSPSASPTPGISLTPTPSSTASPAYSHTFTPTITPTFTISPVPATPAAMDCNDPNDHDPWRVKVPGNIVKGRRDHVEILMKPCERGPSKVWIYDASGDLVWQWQGDTGIGVQANGTVVITMPLQDASADPLPSGAYRVVYQDASAQQWDTTFVIVR